jgi:transcriptional regulator GlxA family with amidase domain
MSPSQLSRRFKGALGTNPAEYRTQCRVQEARRLLLETAMSVEEIAEACGFENGFYFSRVFTRETGQPPSRFRKNYRV